MMDLAGVVVTMDDVRASGYCAAGARTWFRQHGIDFAAFLKHGIDAGDFIARGDALAEKVVRDKLERAHG